MDFLAQLVNADKLGGWVRAGVASLLGVLIAKSPGLSDILDPQTQAEIGVAVAALIVGVWSHYVKSAQGTAK